MNTEFIVSMIGTDRSGLIKQCMQATQDLEGLWLSSRFSNLDGQLAALIKLSVAEQNVQQLQQFFSALPDLTVQFSPSCGTVNSHETTLKLNIEARDRFGLINQITERLLSLGVIITDMKCNRISVIEIGGSLLSADITLHLPAETTPEQVLNKLDNLGDNAVVNVID
ncbi:MAG: ACT domain-containing protein [Halopseudomonas sp.]